VEKVLFAKEAFGVVKVVSEDGGRRGRGEKKSRCPPCSQHPLEYCNVDGLSFVGRCGHFSYRGQSRYIAEHSFVSCKNIDVYDDLACRFQYSMGVWKNVYKVCDQYDGEKAEFQYGFGPQFPRDDINPSHLYRGLYALWVWNFYLGILTISDVF
jgi:hypothetical protein